jgi:Flp pilus assembly protein TadG
MSQSRDLRVPGRRPALALRRLWRDQCGSSLIETACFLGFLGAPLILGTADLAYGFYDSIEIANAAHAGAVFAMANAANAENAAAIIMAAQADAADIGTNLAVSSFVFYVCSNNEGGTPYTGASAQSQATAACTGAGNHALEFVSVTASALIAPPVHMPGLPASFTIAKTSAMEVEE